MALVCVVGSRLAGRIVVVELGNVAAVRRREVCIDIVDWGGVERRVWIWGVGEDAVPVDVSGGCYAVVEVESRVEVR